MDAPGEKVLIKILDAFERGTGALLLPWQIKRVSTARALARRDELLMLEQARKDIADIKSGQKRLTYEGALQLLQDTKDEQSQEAASVSPHKGTSSPLNNLLKEHKIDFTVRELERWVNLKEIGLKAEEEAEDVTDEDVSSDPIDPDWFSRWRIEAQEVSKDELQRLWARVLAGEARNPGSYSLHTLSFLARMSIDEAKLIARVAPFRLDKSHIYARANDFLEKKGIHFAELLTLEDIGVINGALGIGTLSWVYPVHKMNGETYAAIKNNDLALVLYVDENTKKIDIPIYSISKVGSEIMTLGNFTGDREYLCEIAKNERKKFRSASIGKLKGTNWISDLEVIECD